MQQTNFMFIQFVQIEQQHTKEEYMCELIAYFNSWGGRSTIRGLQKFKACIWMLYMFSKLEWVCWLPIN